MKEVDLIFINWNSADLLLPAVATLKASKSQIDWQITVVDNGSTDDSCEMIRREVPEANIIEVGWNSGFAAAVNVGLKNSKLPYALILNTDVEFRNDVVGLMIEALKQNSKAVMACPELIRPDNSLQAAVVPEPNLLNELTSRSLARRFLKYDKSKTCEVPSVVGPCMGIDRVALAKLEMQEPAGLFDERFFFFLEETDFCHRINQAGGKVLFVPEAKLIHAQGESANKKPVRARIQFYESRYIYFKKHYGKLATFILFLGCTFRTLFNTVGQVVSGLLMPWKMNKCRNKAAVYLSLLAWHLKGCPKGHSFDQRFNTKKPIVK
ncbi:MAG: glycosyltransferase family 2 protein [Lentisphaeria bacterium]|nr:glycosyltransferase family 2 protein [Lentisphaeria bacterium]